MSLVRQALRFVFGLFTSVFGRFNWTLPPWLRYLNTLRKRSKTKFVGLLALLCLAFYVAYISINYYQNRPQAILVTANIQVPIPLTFDQIEDKLSPNPLIVEFVYNKPVNLDDTGDRLSVVDFPSVAPLNDVGYEVYEGISISPNIAGRWAWQDDRILKFEPTTDWPPGQTYTISFDSTVFDTQEKFEDDEFSFTTVPLKIDLEEFEFEMDVSRDLREVYATFYFSHPVEKQSFENALNFAYQNVPDGQTSAAQQSNSHQPKPVPKIEFDDDMLGAYVAIEIDTLPSHSRFLVLTLNEGVKSIYGGLPSADKIDQKVVVPDRFSYLKVDNASSSILRDEQNQPDQFVLLEFTDDVSQDVLENHLELYLLPALWAENDQSNQSQQTRSVRKQWQSPRQITSQVLGSSTLVDYVLMPNPKSASKNYQLKMDVVPGRQLYLRLKPGMTSVNDFVHKSAFDKILVAPTYPKEVNIFGEGSVLTHNPQQRLSFSTRGVPSVKVRVGRLMQDQLYHLVTQTSGDLSNPQFSSWQFNEENLSVFNSQIMNMVNTNEASIDPKKAAYGNVNLLNYLAKETNSNAPALGLFFVEITGWDPINKREIRGVSDKRLILMTNLGVIVKTDAQRNQYVFVQSLVTGQPVANAKVELLGKNGIPVMSAVTNQQGSAKLPVPNDLTKEKRPSVYVITHKDDVSFLPFNRYTRQINYSRFNVAGVYNNNNRNQMTAYLFSDRGIYRPGEMVNLAGIVKNKGFDSVEGVPVVLEIRDAQYKVVETTEISLPRFGMFDFQYQSNKQATTGNYEAALYLMRNNNKGTRYRYHLGQVNFQVEEFQADTVSIDYILDKIEPIGWTTTSNIKANIRMQNLFGLPAQNREVDFSVELVPTQFKFTQFKDYQFGVNPKDSVNTDGRATQNLSRQDIQFASQTTNADGMSIFDIDLTDFNQGAYRVNFTTQGFEQSGGRSVSARGSFLYSVMPYMVGIKTSGSVDYLNLDSEHKVEFVAVSNQLKPVSVDNLRLTINRISSVSTLVKQSNGRLEYESIEQRQLLSTNAFSISNETTLHLIDTSTPGDYVLEVIDSTNQVLNMLEYTVVGQGNITGKLEQNADLKIALSKTSYKAGEEIELSIQAPYKGSGLITIESDTVHSFKWFHSEYKNTIERITIPEGIEGNAYINVSYLRDVSSPNIYMSPLSYAVAPFYIDRSKRIIDVDVSVDNIVQPGDTMRIDVNLSQSAQMIVFAIDTGILQVARYKMPAPLDFFFKKRALSVRTMQMLDMILPDYALTQLLMANVVSAAGGDLYESMDKISVTGSKMRRTDAFAREVEDPVVFWSGVVLAQKGLNTVYFEVPNTFAGGLQVMAVAVNDNAMGQAKKGSFVRGPFVLTPNVPTHVTPNDKFAVTLGVANVLEGSGEDALLHISIEHSEHLLHVDEQGNNIQQPTNQRRLDLNEGSEDSLTYWFKATDVLGGAKVDFTVKHTDQSGKTYTTTQQATIKVRPNNPYSVDIVLGAVEADELVLDVQQNVYPQQSTQLFSASASPLVLIEGLSTYLAEFPHGCTEQMVSQVFPIVGLSHSPKYQARNEDVQAQFSELITSLRQRQNYDGGFNYWPSNSTFGETNSDPYVSVYVLHFLLEAQDLNFNVPSAMLESGMRYLESLYFDKLLNQNRKPALIQMRNRAHAIYLLSRSGLVSSNLIIDWTTTMQKHYEKTWQSDISAAYIAASYALLQQYNEAKSGFEKYKWMQHSNEQKVQVNGLFTPLSLNSQYLFLVAKHMPELLSNGSISNDDILPITKAIYQGQYNTHSAAFSTLSLAAYHHALQKNSGVEIGQVDAALRLQAVIPDGEINLPFAQAGADGNGSASSGFPLAQYPFDTSELKLTVENTLPSDVESLYYINVQAGYKVEAPSSSIKNGIEVTRVFLNQAGEEVKTAKQGDELFVQLRMRATKQKFIDDVAITDMLPGGFTVMRDSIRKSANDMPEAFSNMHSWCPEHVEIKEDRIVYYGRLSNRMTQFIYKVKVIAAGDFSVSPVIAESMYDRSLVAQSMAGSFKVSQD